MTRARGIAAGIALTAVLCGPAAPARADPYIERLCMENPSYRSMHEDQCQAPTDSNNKHPSGGLLGAIGHLLGGLL